MNSEIAKNTDLILETSWEVCNKIGGIYTVLSTKAAELKKMFGDRLVFIGPDIKGADGENSCFTQRKTLLNHFERVKLPYGLKVRCGRWNIPGSPLVVLVDFKGIYPVLNEIYGEMWNAFGVDSLHAYGDYDESCAFSVAAAIVMMALTERLGADPSKTIAHFNEWTTGMGLLYVKLRQPETATVFTTHATTVGRSICSNGKSLYEYFSGYHGDQMAAELNVESKHSLEKAAALNADCFTTVSDVTARECQQFFGKYPDVVTPNGFEPSFVPGDDKWRSLRKRGRKRILKIASLLTSKSLNDDTLIVATSGRNEFRNKGLDLFLDSLYELALKVGDRQHVVGLVLVPAWVKQPSGDLLIDLDFGGWIQPDPNYLTHRLHNEESDSVACKIRDLQTKMEQNGIQGKVSLIFVPSYLDGDDGIVNISYYDFLPALDITVFGSYYEPWGYTPLESVAFGIPTVTTDKAGFGQWAKDTNAASLEKGGVEVISREDSNYNESMDAIAEILYRYMNLDKEAREQIRQASLQTASKAEWRFFISKYLEAFETAFQNSRKRQ